MANTEDKVLMKQLQKGKTEALGALFERYKTVLLNFFLRTTHNYDTSNDLLIETFERVYKYRNSFKLHSAVKPWIYQIASNLVKDHFNRHNRLKKVELSSIESYIDNDLPRDDFDNKNERLMTAIKQLKPNESRIVTMYYLMEMKYEDIAQQESITVNKARIIVCRSLKKLRIFLKNKEL